MSEVAPAAPLQGLHLVTLAVNVPGPVAAARLCQLGARVTKVEPPGGDPLAVHSRSWYEALARGQTVERIDLKSEDGAARMEDLLAGADLLLTSHRPSALARLGLDWASVHGRHLRLCQVAIVGDPHPRSEVAGHDLTYQATAGLLQPPSLPRTLMADLAGAERAVSEALALLLGRERDGVARFGEVALRDAAWDYAAPYRHGLTTTEGILGGGLPGYNLYAARTGWVAVAALEPHFGQRLGDRLGLENPSRDELAAVFVTRDAADWEAWALEHDVPLTAAG